MRKNYILWNSKELKEIELQVVLVKNKEKSLYRAARDLEKSLQRSYDSIYAQLQRFLKK